MRAKTCGTGKKYSAIQTETVPNLKRRRRTVPIKRQDMPDMFFCSEQLSDSRRENRPCRTKRERGVRNGEYGAVLFLQEVPLRPMNVRNGFTGCGTVLQEPCGT